MVRSLVRESQRGFLGLIFGRRFAFSHNAKSSQQLNRCNNPYGNCVLQGFSTIGGKREKLCRKGASRSILLGKLESALKEHQVDEAWETYKDFKRLYGFPDQFLVANLITESSYSADPKCLRRACDLVLSTSKEKSVLLRPEMMTKLALSLARAQIPVAASSVLRLMVEKRSLPPLDVLRMVFLHLVKTEIGTYLGSNILDEICCCFQKLTVNKSAQAELTKPDVTIFNLVLDACVRFGSALKGQQIIELMPQVGAIADAHTAVIIARIHEMNGMRDELKKFKDYVDMVPVTLIRHYQQFYDCLLSLHFKFNDIDGASALLMDLCGCSESNPFQRGQKEQLKSCSVSIGSDNIRMGLRLQFLPQQLQRDFVNKVDSKQELILYKSGKFLLSNKGLAKLIIGYKRSGRINGLSRLLICIHNMLSSDENNRSCSDVIDACIYLGWLETAHDILDDLESEKYCVRESSYTSLLAAYYNKKMLREAEGLVRQIRRVGLAINFPDEMAFSLLVSKSEDERTPDSMGKSDLANSIIQSMREEDKAVSPFVHEYNSSIYFFTKAKMIEDATQTYRKMQKMKIQPNASTFFHLICGYCSLAMYREITILWGDIKRSMENQNTVYNRDLYELLLLNFIRGAYFERVMEVIGFMMENNMFLDKWSYKTEFLKLHRDLYRTLTSLEAKDDAQKRRIEHVQAFRKFVGIV
ncbi:Pentatricopeptide repeat-containing protein [Sesamum alatum]|uniref:Pentatricopeptide repeat-containing protein n=1 Tax=Sesamum alatum TaxID=300844 RepID=A0AAE2CHI3_9LAMI|nr:Pentatricopeptide repeat-containing protein [Sesamum alatum]